MEILSQDSLYVYEFGDLDMYAVCIRAFLGELHRLNAVLPI